MKRIFITLLSTVLIIGMVGCSSSTDKNTNVAETTILQTEIPKIDVSDYKDKVSSLTTEIEDASVLLSNMANYEYNYMESLYNISGRIDSESAVEKGREWLSENGEVETDCIDKDFNEITNLYFEIEKLELPNEVQNIGEKLSDLYNEYSALYTQVTTASDFNNFADDYNNHVDTITNLVNVLKAISESEE